MAKWVFSCYYFIKIFMSWAAKRKLIYLLIVVGVLAAFSAVPLWRVFNKPPTCFDGKQNQGERGVDCGGSCSLACKEDVSPLVVEWSRAFKVEDGVYDIVAFIENQNSNYGVKKAIYHFKIYDKDNILIAEKFGKTYVKEREKFAVFEGGIKTGKRVPQRVFFEFDPEMSWEKISTKPLGVSTKDKSIADIDSKPRLNATIVNESFSAIKNMDIVAVLYDINDNAVSVSSTIVSFLDKNSSKEVAFTWQEPFLVNPSRIDIIPRVNPFDSE